MTMPPHDRMAMPRLWRTVQHYRGRAWRWARVVSEWRPGTVRPHAGRKRVLVTRLDAIGDFVLWSGAARALRQWLGDDAHVTLVANAVWADLARDAGIADDVWPVSRESLAADSAYRATLRARVAEAGFALAINPRHTREMLFDDSVVRWSRAPERVGSRGEGHLLPPRERAVADAWYTRLVAPSSATMHETERHAEFLAQLGARVDGVPVPSLAVAPSAAHEAGELPAEYFVVFPGASLPEKQWAPARFAEVARHVHAQTGLTPVLLGDGRDASATVAVRAQVPTARDLTGRTSIAAFAAVIQGAQLVLTNDTAAVHLAAATGVPAVCVTGGWQWRRFVPYPAVLGAMATRVQVVSVEQEMPCFECRGPCVQPHVAGEALPCVARVPVTAVIDAVDHALSRVTT